MQARMLWRPLALNSDATRLLATAEFSIWQWLFALHPPRVCRIVAVSAAFYEHALSLGSNRNATTTMKKRSFWMLRPTTVPPLSPRGRCFPVVGVRQNHWPPPFVSLIVEGEEGGWNYEDGQHLNNGNFRFFILEYIRKLNNEILIKFQRRFFRSKTMTSFLEWSEKMF